MSRDSVMDAALALADRDGFGALTMRAIATEVGATPMALYAYFSDKTALYAGMRERIFFVHVGAETISVSVRRNASPRQAAAALTFSRACRG